MSTLHFTIKGGGLHSTVLYWFWLINRIGVVNHNSCHWVQCLLTFCRLWKYWLKLLQRQEEESAPKGQSGVVEMAKVTDEPEPQPEDEPSTPEDNRTPTLLGPLGPPQVMSQELIRGLVEAISNIAFGQTLSGQGSTAGPQGASRSTGPPLPPPPFLGKGKGKGSRVSPYPPRGGRAPALQQSLVIAPQGSSAAQGLGILSKIVYKEPYYPWNPTKAQLLDCRDMLRGEGDTMLISSAFTWRTPDEPRTISGPVSGVVATVS